MKKRIKFNSKYLNISFVAMVIAAALISWFLFWLYGIARQSLVSAFKTSTVRASSDVDYFFSTPMDAVSYAATGLNELLSEGASPIEIYEYLKSDTDVFSTLIESNHSGVYACYKGDLIDGSDWTPDEGYDPTVRPWYTAAVEGKGRTVLVLPYMNMKTHTMMISVSKLLQDGESVVAMDLFLVQLQDLLKKMVVENGAEAALILDKSGVVIAHSDHGEVGEDYSTGQNELGGKLLEAVKTTYDGTVAINNGDESDAVFFDRCTSGLYVVLVVNEETAYRPMQRIYLFAGLAFIIVMLCVFAAFAHMGFKQNEVENLGREILAVADIYMTMIRIDVDSDTVALIRNGEEVAGLFEGNYENYSKRINGFIKKRATERYVQHVEEFLDMSTLDSRLEHTNTIGFEFLDYNEKWVRAKFFVLKRDGNNHITEVLLAFESVDEERRRQEQLKKLSEIDRMTGILNRGSGEQRVREKLLTADSGMFCLMDADKFKSINDSFGHAAGDKVIIAIADTLKEIFRDTDVVFRLGGDEFAVFAMDVRDEKAGNMIIDRLFGKIDAIKIPELGDYRISVSLGATLYSRDMGEAFETLYKRADEATYVSKRSAGNKASFG